MMSRKAAFGSFGEYWKVRNEKLRQQHEQITETWVHLLTHPFLKLGSEAISDLFRGITVWIDGYVEPSMV